MPVAEASSIDVFADKLSGKASQMGQRVTPTGPQESPN